MCQYCRAKSISSYIDDKISIPTNYCPVCGNKFQEKIIQTYNIDIVDYISKQEVVSKLSIEARKNLPEKISYLCESLKIPENLKPLVHEIVDRELDDVMSMLDCHDTFTVFTPSQVL